MKTRILFAVILTLVATTTVADVRMWRDADGNLIFGDVPPAEVEQAAAQSLEQELVNTYSGQSDVLRLQIQKLERQQREMERGRATMAPSISPLDPLNDPMTAHDRRTRMHNLEHRKRRILEAVERADRYGGNAWIYDREVHDLNREIRNLQGYR